jgi:hypothetical protein
MRLTGADRVQTGVAWLCGARFDMAIAELKKGIFRPSMLSNSAEIAADAAKSAGHAEL